MEKVIGLQFAEPLRLEGLKLVALPPDVEKAIENGEEVCFKSAGAGNGAARAVLCTATATYRLVNVESSNVSFLADISKARDGSDRRAGGAGAGGGGSKDGSDKAQANVVVIGDQFANTIDMELEVPDFTAMRTAVRQHAFTVSGDTAVADDEAGAAAAAAAAAASGGVRFRDLLAQTCASAAEIPAFLDRDPSILRLPASRAGTSLTRPLHPDDRYFFVADEVLDEQFDQLLSTLMSGSISLTKSEQSVGAVIEACDVKGAGAAAVVRHLIHTLRPRGVSSSTADDAPLHLDPAAVARHRIGYVLRQDLAKEWPLHAFVAEVASDCPVECAAFVTAASVRDSGLALCEVTGASTTVKYLDTGRVPHALDARFEFLFGLKRRWTEAELLPFLRAYAVHGNTVQSLLMQHTRSFNEAVRPGGAEETFYVRR